MAEHSIRVVRVGNPKALEWPPMQELFRSAFKRDDFPDAEWVLKWAREHVENPGTFVAVAIKGDELVGMTIAEYAEGPFNPVPFSLFSYSNGSGAANKLWEMKRDWSIAISGVPDMHFINQSGNSDEWYFDRLKGLATGCHVIGSVISGKWLLPGELEEGDASCLYSGSQSQSEAVAQVPARSPKTSRRKNTKRSADSSRIPMWTRFKAAARRLRGRSPSQ